MDFTIRFESLTYYGRGPFENYQDRNFAAQVGVYRQKVSEQYFHYVIPQETGNKTDVRWFRISNSKGVGLLIYSDSLLNMSALHVLDGELDNGMSQNNRHAADVVKTSLTQLHIDYKQMGVGGIDSWGAKPLNNYLIPLQNYSYKFYLVPEILKN